ncbi:hypothetical protein B0E45_16995 [Sinorhizobium sp. A49]|jgi:hypothetical protein|nr:hypothetical protein B0E45_16995 [Sinorhizobium sp. A49]
MQNGKERRTMPRYMYHIHAAGVTSRDQAGKQHPNDGRAVAYGQLIADELAEEYEYRGAIVDVLSPSGRLIARLVSSRAFPPWLQSTPPAQRALH